MSGTTVDLSQLEAFANSFTDKVEAAAIKGIQSAVARGEREIKAVIIPNKKPRPPTNKGIYKAAWRTEIEPDGASLVNSTPYAPMIEYGVRPESVHYSWTLYYALREWVLQKGIYKRGRSPARTVKAQRKLDAQDAAIDSFIFLMIRKMKKVGIFHDEQGNLGLHILGDLIKEGGPMEKFLQDEIEREVRKAFVK